MRTQVTTTWAKPRKIENGDILIDNNGDPILSNSGERIIVSADYDSDLIQTKWS